MALPYRLTRPPRALRHARLDNIALVPASVLLSKEKYLEAAQRLPNHSVLIIRPRQQHNPRLNVLLERVASLFRDHGRQVTTISAARIAV